MWQWLHRLGSPERAYRYLKTLQYWFAPPAIICLVYGLIGGLYLAPPDYQQGDAFRIIYIHVPSAILSLGLYTSIAVAAFVYLVWKIKLANYFQRVVLPIGAWFTLAVLITGSLWGKPTWGTYWIWDARLTSELILLFIYIGVIALRNAMPSSAMSAKVGSIMAIIGFINIPIIHFSVDWWHTLHQGATILQFAKPTIASSMLHPLLAMIAAFLFGIAWLICVRLRTELLWQEQRARWVRKVLQ